MKKRYIIGFILLNIIITSMFSITKVRSVDIYKSVNFVYNDTFTDRFSDDPIEDATLTFYVDDIFAENFGIELCTVETDEDGNFNVDTSLDLLHINGLRCAYVTHILFDKTGYIEEYYEYDDMVQVKTNHNGDGWTPEYDCVVFGYIKQMIGFNTYPIQGATVELWGEDDHTTEFKLASTTTNSQGYYELTDCFENEYANLEVADFYWIKISKTGFPTVTKNVNPYPYPNGNINVGYTYIYGFY